YLGGESNRRTDASRSGYGAHSGVQQWRARARAQNLARARSVSEHRSAEANETVGITRVTTRSFGEVQDGFNRPASPDAGGNATTRSASPPRRERGPSRPGAAAPNRHGSGPRTGNAAGTVDPSS